MRCRLAAWAASSLLTACVISACGGSSDNGVASKSPDGIVNAALGAINSAKSAHVSGSVVSRGFPATLNLDLVSGRGGRGQVSEGGLKFKIEVVGNDVYINGNKAFVDQFLGTGKGAKFQGKWLKPPPASAKSVLLRQLADLHALVDGLLKAHGPLVMYGTRTIDGQSAIGVRDTKQNAVLYVATTGRPYPLEILNTGAQSGSVKLSRFDQSVSLTPPVNALDTSHLK